MDAVSRVKRHGVPALKRSARTAARLWTSPRVRLTVRVLFIALALGTDREARMHARARIAETAPALFGDPRPVGEFTEMIEAELAARS